MDKELIRRTAKSLGEDRKMVDASIDFYVQFIVDTIKKGAYENVRVPLLGVFKVNLRKLKYKTHVETLPKTTLVRREGSKPPRKYRRK